MKTQTLDQTVYHVAAETVESLAMMFLVTADEAPACAGSTAVGVTVSFTGPFDGAVEIAADRAVLIELASNMLGLEAPADEACGIDALKELANVICGNLLPAIAGCEPVFHIAAPTLKTDAPCADGCQPAGSARLYTESGALDVRFFMRAADSRSTGVSPTEEEVHGRRCRAAHGQDARATHGQDAHATAESEQ